MTKIHHYILLFIFMISLSCKTDNEVTTTYKVNYYGALKNIMSGNLEQTIRLDTLKTTDHIYAIGAVKHLKGEIQIFDGVPSNSRVQNQQLVIDSTYNNAATLFVYAQVEAWETFTLNNVENHQSLETIIASTAKQYGIDTSQPFPFVIEGKVNELDWHVIDWKEGDKEHTHKKHQTSGLNGKIIEDQVTILGFFSTKHTGIFTHHTTNLHMHFKNSDNTIAGHVDHIIPSNSITLKLPKK